MTAMLAESSSGVNFDRVSLCALSSSTRELLSNCLNTKKLLPSENNYLRDWRGLAQLAKVTVPADSANPTQNVIHMWQISSVDDPRPTVGNLLSFLGQIDRWDVVDDLKEQILNDAKEFSDGRSRPLMPSQIDERDLITLDDVERYRQGLPLQKYDAFFLYVDEDAGFANDIVSLLESEFNLRLCLKDRDLVGGIRFEYDAIMKLIANRCSYLIVVISKDFINSEADNFFLKYAQALSIEQGRRKIVPCVYNARIIDVPPQFKFYFLLDRSRSNSLRDYCLRLRASIAPRCAPALPAPAISQEDIQVRCTIEEISSESQRRLNVNGSPPVSLSELSSSSRGDTQVVQMPDPSAFLSPEKSQVGFSAEPSSSSVSKPVSPSSRSPAVRIKEIFNRSKGSSVEPTTNGTGQPEKKTKKKNSWFPSKKKIAVTES